MLHWNYGVRLLEGIKMYFKDPVPKFSLLILIIVTGQGLLLLEKIAE